MKIKADFITNSSSTNFYFVFKGDHIDLYQRLIEHRIDFDLTFETYDDLVLDITTWDVIREIDKAIRVNEKDLWLLKEVDSVNSVINYFEEKKVAILDLIEIQKKSGTSIDANFYKTDLKTIDENIQHLERSKKKGLTSCLMISFGDNHGDVIGDPVGTTMDYSGRGTFIDCPEFVVFTEQDR